MSEWLTTEPKRDSTVIATIVGTAANKAFCGHVTVAPVYIDEDGVVCDPGTFKRDRGILNGNFRMTHWMPLPPPPKQD